MAMKITRTSIERVLSALTTFQAAFPSNTPDISRICAVKNLVPLDGEGAVAVCRSQCCNPGPGGCLRRGCVDRDARQGGNRVRLLLCSVQLWGALGDVWRRGNREWTRLGATPRYLVGKPTQFAESRSANLKSELGRICCFVTLAKIYGQV